MSQENVETVQRAHEAWDAGDLDAWLAELDPEAEWHTAMGQALEGSKSVYRGYDGARKSWDEFRGKAWGSFTSRIQEIRDLGESILVLGHLDLSHRTGGIELTEEFGQLFTFRGGKVLRVEDFLSHAETLEAAGLRE